MIPTLFFRKPELTLPVIDGLTVTAVFWAYHAGLVSKIIDVDFTYLAVIIFGLFVYASLSLTVMSYELSKHIDERHEAMAHHVIATSLFYTKIDVVAFISVMLPTLGFLGTVIGLSSMMGAAEGIQIDNFMSIVGPASGAALFPTMVGTAAFLVLSLKRFILTHSFRIHGLAREL